MELECPVCKDAYKTPKCLPCGHVVCRVCLLSCISSSSHQGVCPVCRETLVSSTDLEIYDLDYFVDALPTDHTVEANITYLKTLSGNHVCEICPDGIATSSICLDCNMKLCETCVKAHSKFPAFKQHVMEEISVLTTKFPISEAQVVNCHTHPDNPMDLCCTIHRQRICIECAPEHVRCGQVKRWRDFARQQRQLLKSQAQALLEHGTAIRSQTDRLEQNIHQCEQEFKSLRMDINCKLDDLQKALLERRRELSKLLQNLETDFLQPKATRLALLKEVSALVTSYGHAAIRAAEASPDVNLLDVVNKLKPRLNEMEAKSEKALQSEFSNSPENVDDTSNVKLNNFTVDIAIDNLSISRLKSEIDSLNFISVLNKCVSSDAEQTTTPVLAAQSAKVKAAIGCLTAKDPFVDGKSTQTSESQQSSQPSIPTATSAVSGDQSTDHHQKGSRSAASARHVTTSSSHVSAASARHVTTSSSHVSAASARHVTTSSSHVSAASARPVTTSSSHVSAESARHVTTSSSHVSAASARHVTTSSSHVSAASARHVTTSSSHVSAASARHVTTSSSHISADKPAVPHCLLNLVSRSPLKNYKAQTTDNSITGWDNPRTSELVASYKTVDCQVQFGRVLNPGRKTYPSPYEKRNSSRDNGLPATKQIEFALSAHRGLPNQQGKLLSNDVKVGEVPLRRARSSTDLSAIRPGSLIQQQAGNKEMKSKGRAFNVTANPSLAERVRVGSRVKRGIHWSSFYEDLDGGLGGQGEVLKMGKGNHTFGKGWVLVRWDITERLKWYRMGAENCFDLSLTW